MSKGEFILCDNYLVKDSRDQDKPKRLFGIFSFNQYGSQGKDHVTFHVLERNGIECISGQYAKLVPLRWYQKDVNRAAMLGGIAGAIVSICVQVIIRMVRSV